MPSLAAPAPDLAPRARLRTLTSMELFAGGGGMARGMHDAGLQPVLLNEWARYPCATLRHNLALLANDARQPDIFEGDVRSLIVDELHDQVDLLAGGPPCQPFSMGGAHRAQLDPRDMFPAFAQVLAQVRPRAFVCENVLGLARPAFRGYLDHVIDLLRDHGYVVGWWQVNAADYGVPQIRKRVIIHGFRTNLGIEPTMPSATHSGAALVASLDEGSYWCRHGIAAREVPHRGLGHGDATLRPWRTVRDAIGDLPTPLHGRERAGYTHHVGWPGARTYIGHTPNLLDRPSKTIKAGVHGVPGGEHTVCTDAGQLRYYTVREAARIMTFPDEWFFAGPRSEQMRQIGNAVPVALASAIAQHVAGQLD